MWKKIKVEITMKINFQDMQVTEKQPSRYKVCTNVESKTGNRVFQKTWCVRSSQQTTESWNDLKSQDT